MLNWVLTKWDWMVYRLAFYSLRRMATRNGGFAYLLELWIREWRLQNPIPRELKRSTELFFESIVQESRK